jgi:hypothetical protein
MGDRREEKFMQYITFIATLCVTSITCNQFSILDLVYRNQNDPKSLAKLQQ